MAIERKAVVRESDNIIINIIDIDVDDQGVSTDWIVPPGHRLEDAPTRSDAVGVGDIHDGFDFIKRVVTQDEIDNKNDQSRILQLRDDLQAKDLTLVELNELARLERK